MRDSNYVILGCRYLYSLNTFHFMSIFPLCDKSNADKHYVRGCSSLTFLEKSPLYSHYVIVFAVFCFKPSKQFYLIQSKRKKKKHVRCHLLSFFV